MAAKAPTTPRARRRQRGHLFSGWRKAGVINTVLIWLLTIALLASLITSIAGFRNADVPISVSSLGISTIYTGSCGRSSDVNISVHVVINAIGTLILASSNFFMQVLTAPTRENVDAGHARGDFLEIGVQSLRNLTRRAFPKLKALFWVVLSLSSVPFHLFLNASVYTVNVSTENYLIMASEAFLDGADFVVPGAGADHYDWTSSTFYDFRPERKAGAEKFVAGIAANATGWENVTIEACMDIYNDPTVPLRSHRNFVMVVQEPGNSSTVGWRTSEMRPDLPAANRSSEVNSLFLMDNMWLTDNYIQWSEAAVGMETSFTEEDELISRLKLDMDTKIMVPQFTSQPSELEALYCLVEPIDEACEVRVANFTLLIVWIVSFLKALVCLASILKFRRDEPLVTPGDAIDSFISTPDMSTAGMCTAGAPSKPRFASRGQARWNRAPEPWTTGSKPRRLSFAVPRWMWMLSYLIFALFVGIGIWLMVEGSRMQPLTKSPFGPTSQTLGHNLNVGGIRSDDMGDVHRALFANLPHLALSMSYFAYNNIVTRMVAEREFSAFGRRFQPLRVSVPRGAQSSTYRLQLPYLWSVCLVTMSGFLHWMVSNCIFPKVNIAYESFEPYAESTWSGRGLGYSTLSIFITVVICFFATLVPIFLGRRKLERDMVVAAGNSVVLSSACHAVLPPAGSGFGFGESDVGTALMQDGQQLFDERGRGRREGEECGEGQSWTTSWQGCEQQQSEPYLRALASEKIKWGVVVPNQNGYPGHLSFATMEQYVGPPQEDHWYSGGEKHLHG
ncbi:hypothetical protein MKZ38_002290 [Zalerion maritima]|uniref:DUF6536 domain-containing protein n=1 Tax=Zalerion maritima TaxID=339359 RepID=A0AAD5RVV1_9PEZI|nr:hypothetical protein MKZ38_002290 [Zalerion maritima]